MRTLAWVALISLSGCWPLCPAPPPICCEGGCNSDIVVEPVCGYRGWTCPQGSASADECPPNEMFCGGPGVAGCAGTPPNCCSGGCNGDVGVDSVCTDAGWDCPPGSVSPDECPPTTQFCSGGPVATDGG